MGKNYWDETVFDMYIGARNFNADIVIVRAGENVNRDMLSNKKILLELDKIKCLDLKTQFKPRFRNPISKSQRDVFDALEISAPD